MATAAQKSAAAMMKEIMDGLGMKAPDQDIIEKMTPETLKDTPQRVSFRGQAVLRSLEYPEAERITRICKSELCSRYYTTNYYAVAYCSNECMETEMRTRYGIAWIPHTSVKKERWEIRAEPEMIPMQALQAMKMIVSRVEHDLGHPIEIDELVFSQLPPGLLRPSEMKPSLASELESLLEPEDPLLLDKQKDQVQEEPSQVIGDDLLSWLYAE